MRFIDEVTISVEAGAGGDGCVAFRREAHVPHGGPSGGDGGRGGHVVIEASEDVGTLLDLRYRRQYRAERGKHGQPHDCHGRGGADVVIVVPPGTLVFDATSGERLADLVASGEQVIAARGGRGGRGNMRFATSVNRAPRQAEPGEPGEARELRLELKLLADVGLVGLPNAGKSTLIARVSAARPKIADYPFTTLVPNLGVVAVGDDRRMVIADIPGLIEGAAEGAGLGHRFLKHIERTKLIVFLLDDRRHQEGGEGGPFDDLGVLCAELAAHASGLDQRPSLIAINKCDRLAPERRAELVAAAGERPVLFVSGLTGEGIPELLAQLAERLSDPA